MLSNRLIDELGLLRLVPKQSQQNQLAQTIEQATTATTLQTGSFPEQSSEKLDKHEFRLLVKMLQAIGHDCQYDHIAYDGTVVKYQLPNKILVFHDISSPDNNDTMHLASLADIIANPTLKRPVWEKLKTLMP
ncbi:MAG: hypothetical protein KDI92_11120 [Xanthomonadales bacterium]|nr:hypothetical protein [Xanthomonadales bacterium]